MLTNTDIVCVGFSDWGKDLLTNEQHLLSRLARDNRILYIESLGIRQPQLAGRDLKRIVRRLSRALRPLRTIDGIHVLSPLVLPLHKYGWARRINAVLLSRAVRRATRKLGLHDVLLWSFMPQAEVLIDALEPRTVLYYVDDDHGAKKGIDAESFRAAEESYARRSDVILASAPELVERMRGLNDNVHFAPNVADTALFATTLEEGLVDPSVDELPRPRIVFIGAIVANKLDLDLIVELARLRPNWSFPFIGPVGPGDPSTDVEALRHVPNLQLLGHRPYERLPEVLRGADVAILPYHVDGEMRSVFPMKTYEYLAAGLPVVATPLPALADVDDVLKADDAAAMIACLEQQLASDDRREREARSERARSHSWESRLDQVGDVVRAAGH